MSEDKCLRCGKCCYLVDLNTMKQTDIPCRYLIKFSNNEYFCRIYNRNRLGRNLGKGNKCNLREHVKYNYEGCPYNVKGQPFMKRS